MIDCPMADARPKDRVGGIEIERAVGGRLTAATLPVAEMAPTARDDCLRAFRNILGACLNVPRSEGRQLQAGCNCVEGRSSDGGDAFARVKERFLEDSQRDFVTGREWSPSWPTNQSQPTASSPERGIPTHFHLQPHIVDVSMPWNRYNFFHKFICLWVRLHSVSQQ